MRDLRRGLLATLPLAPGIVAWRTLSVLWTIVSGMAAYWLFRIVGL